MPTTLPADDAQVQDAFLSEIDNVVAEATDLSVTPCDDMAQVLKTNPNLVPSLHGFAATLQQVGTTQPALDSVDVKAALDDLDATMSQLDSALSQCGLAQP